MDVVERAIRATTKSLRREHISEFGWNWGSKLWRKVDKQVRVGSGHIGPANTL